MKALFRIKTLRPVITLLLLALLLLVCPGTAVHAEYRGYTYEDADLIAKPALFTNTRIQRESVPRGWFCYNTGVSIPSQKARKI